MKGRMNAIQTLQDRSSYSKQEGNWIDWTYWDRAVLASTVLNHRLFTIPFGQGGKVKSDTNWLNANNLPQGQSFDIFALKIGYKAAAIRNNAAIQSIYDTLFNTVATIRVPGKDSLGEWLLSELFGVIWGIEHVPTVAGDNVFGKTEKFSGVFPLNRKLTVGATQTIEIDITHYAAPAQALDGDKIYIGLNGLLLRLS